MKGTRKLQAKPCVLSRSPPSKFAEFLKIPEVWTTKHLQVPWDAYDTNDCLVFQRVLVGNFVRFGNSC